LVQVSSVLFGVVPTDLWSVAVELAALAAAGTLRPGFRPDAHRKWI
jgi:hypothetical protein